MSAPWNHRLAWFSSFSLRAELALGFATVIALTLFVVAVSLLAQERSVRVLNRLVEVDGVVAGLSLRSNVAILTARHAEKDFLLFQRRIGFEEARSRYVALFRASLAEVRDNMGQIRARADHPELGVQFQAIEQAVSRYEAGFLRTVELYGRLGQVDTGIEGEFRDKAHAIEEIVGAAREDRLMVGLLTLRRHEKDFILRGADKYASEFADAIDQFKAALASARLSPAIRQRLLGLTNGYRTLFDLYVQIDQRAAAETASYLAAVRSVEPLLAKLYSGATRSEAATRIEAERRAQITAWVISSTGLIALVSGLMVAWLVSRSITRSLGACLGFAKRVAEGDLTARLTLGDRNEFGTLAAALNQMTEALESSSASQEARRMAELVCANRALRIEVVERQRVEETLHESEAGLRRVNRVLAMLSGIGALMVRVRDRDELFREACRIAVEAGRFPLAWIGVVDRAAHVLVPVAWVGPGREHAGKLQLAVGDAAPDAGGLAAQAVTQKRAVVSNDVAHDPRVVLKAEMLAHGLGSVVALPLILHGEALGTLTLAAAESGFFDDEEMQLLLQLAGDIGFALDHIEKEDKVRRLTRVHAVLSGINTLIVRVRERDELFREACRIAVEDGQFKMAWIGVVDWSAMKITPIASAGAEPEFLALIKDRFSLREDAPLGMTISARAVREKKPIVSNEIRGDTKIFFAKDRIARGIYSIAVLPLLVSDTVVGVLALYAGETGYFDEEEMKLLTELAGDIAFATDHMDKQARLDYLAYYDALTGLANRGLFLERVAQFMRSAAGGGHKLALFLFDLERFKNINDSLGRPAGDALLRQVAEWLTRNLGDANLFARVDADHFAIVLPKVELEGDVARLVEKTMQAFLEHSFRLNDSVFRIAAKVGIALYPDDGADADTLFRNAEAALKKAKASGERYLFYTQTMTAAVAGKLTLENQLRQALDNEEFVLHYQPKVNLASGKLTSAEALIRWNDPRTGLVPPGRFIPILEETGLIYEVGRWALRQAIEDYLRWRNAGLPAVRIAVNVSPLQLRHRGFIAEIEQVISVDAQAAAGLELEITESLIMEDVKHNIASLQGIRAMGVTIAIDDFGTGFSSLSYLAKLPVDTLKIDRSFVIDMTAGPEGLALVSTIITLAHSLKLKVVAEGVETEEQSRLLRLLDCDEMQGFLFSKPVPGEMFEARFLSPPPARRLGDEPSS